MELALEKANKPVFGSFLFFISKCSLYPTFTFARVPLYLMHAVLCFHIRRPYLTEMIISANSRIQSK